MVLKIEGLWNQRVGGMGGAWKGERAVRQRRAIRLYVVHNRRLVGLCHRDSRSLTPLASRWPEPGLTRR